MTAITTLAQPQSASSLVQFREIQRVTPFSNAGPRPALETELSDIIGRVVTGVVAEAQAAVARSRGAEQVALEAARAALEEQAHRNDGLSESLLQSERLIEELRRKLEVEREKTKAATDAYETAHKARVEEANEAQATRHQLVAAYELRLHTLQAELDASRAALIDLKQQYEVEAAGRARAIAALKTVQQTCALVESQAQGPAGRVQDRLQPPAREDGACEIHEATTADPMRDVETLDGAGSAAPDGALELVAPDTVTPPPHLAEYLRELFEQIKTTYIMDLQTQAMVVVVDRLGANVRHARDLFMQRGSVENVVAADVLFDQALSAKLNEFGATSLGRHLAIVAYELAHADAADVCVEAS